MFKNQDLPLDVLTKEKLKSKPFVNPMPYVVILGAGASKQAFLNGDRNSKLVPLWFSELAKTETIEE